MKSSNVVSMQQPVSAIVYTARVLSLSNNQGVIELSGSKCAATVCFSCLVRPEINDLVMCVQSEDGHYFITGIIERESKQSMTVAFPADVTMQSLHGSINMMTSESVTIAASSSINCLSDQALHKSRKTTINYDNLTSSGLSAHISFSSIHIFSDLINTISRQVLQKIKNYVRHSEESDLVKTQNMTRQVKGLYSMDAEYSIMLSKKDTKIDAERIHMG